MNDMTPLIIMLALTNKNGFNSIKNAIEAADGFSSKINNMTNMMSMLPKMTNLFQGISSATQNTGEATGSNYIDTLKNMFDTSK